MRGRRMDRKGWTCGERGQKGGKRKKERGGRRGGVYGLQHANKLSSFIVAVSYQSITA